MEVIEGEIHREHAIAERAPGSILNACRSSGTGEGAGKHFHEKIESCPLV